MIPLPLTVDLHILEFAIDNVGYEYYLMMNWLKIDFVDSLGTAVISNSMMVAGEWNILIKGFECIRFSDEICSMHLPY